MKRWEVITRLKSYVADLGHEGIERFAVSCGTTPGHLRNVMHGHRSCSGELAAAIERETQGAIPCEYTAPHLNWNRVRDPAWRWNGGRPVVEVAMSA